MVSTVVFFFFSSRRRHTRYWRDWSSDVCSSDLSAALPGTELGSAKTTAFDVFPGQGRASGGVRAHRFLKGEDTLVLAWVGQRSEERRVGKECRSRWSPYH